MGDISGPEPHLVFATTERGIRGPQGEPGELYAHRCGGTRPLAEAAVPADFGDGWPPTPGSSPIGGDDGGPGVVPFVAGGVAVLALGFLVWLLATRRRRTPPTAP